MISVRSSGSKSSARAVDPTRSQNITLISRRSARALSAASPSSLCPAGGLPSPVAGRSRWPHCPQKFELGGFLLPHAAHRLAKLAPHCVQRPTPPEFVKPQVGHFTSRTSHPARDSASERPVAR